MEPSRFRSSLRLVGPERDLSGDNPWPDAARDYYQHIERYAQRIRSAGDVNEIIGLLDEALRETHSLHGVDDLAHARDQVVRAEDKIAALKRELETVSNLLRVDQLTGILNRRGLEESFAREVARADRHGTPLSVVLLDIDDFKRLNDSCGHEAGDQALAQVAAVARRTLRPQDVLARIGGEEFVVLLPETALKPGLVAMSRLQATLAASPFVYRARKLPLTFSAGIALREAGEPLESLLMRADKALYRAKRAGKNRTCAAA